MTVPLNGNGMHPQECDCACHDPELVELRKRVSAGLKRRTTTTRVQKVRIREMIVQPRLKKLEADTAAGSPQPHPS